MPHIRKEIIVKSPQGLHARPAALFVQIVSKYHSSVTVESAGERVNGKSIMGLLTLGLQQGTQLFLDVVGDDAEIVVAELEKLLSQEDI